MDRCIRTLLFAAAGAFAIAACTGCSSNGGCTATCPLGCNISADCLTCTPSAPDVSEGNACTTNEDCCTGTCVSGACSAATGDGGTGTGTTSGGSTGGGGTNETVGTPCSSADQCSSGYCPTPFTDGGAQVCACNKSGYGPCSQAGDCCSGASCVGTGSSAKCEGAGTTGAGSTGGHPTTGGTGGSTGGGNTCHTAAQPSAPMDAACNPNGGTTEVCNNVTGICTPNCTGQASSFCGTGDYCSTTPPYDGHCEATGGTTGGTGTTATAGSTTGGGTGSSSSSGGTTGGSGSCPAIDPGEFAACGDAGTAACDTGLTCIADAWLGQVFGPVNLCEYACTGTASCNDPSTACFGGHCTLNICSAAGGSPADGGNANSAINGSCAGAAAGDGTCTPVVDPVNCAANGDLCYAICVQGGTAAPGAVCDATAERCTAAGSSCGPAQYCLVAAADAGTGICSDSCDTDGGSTCSGGAACQNLDGFAGACPPPSTTSGGSTGGRGTSGGSTGGGTVGGSTGGGTGGECAGCSSDTTCNSGYDCAQDGVNSNSYCALDCSSGSVTCPSGETCFSDTDADGVTPIDICYPNSQTCGSGGTGGTCGASSDPGTGAQGATCASGADCCSEYCRRGTCRCNAGGDLYPCVTDADCCVATSTGCGTDGLCQ